MVAAFEEQRSAIDSLTNTGVSSDAVLGAVRPSLVGQGFAVEASKARADKVVRPVLFGNQGAPRLTYEVDGFHEEHGIVLEVEAGRGAANNAAHRDIIRASLIVGARFLVLAMMQQYTSGATTWRSYESTLEQLDAIFASERLALPFEGVVVIGY